MPDRKACIKVRPVVIFVNEATNFSKPVAVNDEENNMGATDPAPVTITADSGQLCNDAGFRQKDIHDK
jgi:hypothetical protein